MKVQDVPTILTDATQLLENREYRQARKVIETNGAEIKDWFGPGIFADDGLRFLTVPANDALATGDDESLQAFLKRAVQAEPAAQAVADQMLPGVRLALTMLGQVSSAVGEKSPLPAQYGFRTEETPDGVRVEFNLSGKSLKRIGGEINAESRRLFGRDAIDEEMLQKMSDVSKPNELVVVYPRVGTVNMYLSDYKEERYLKSKGMMLASRDDVALATGFNRLLNGNDLLKGRYVHAWPGSFLISTSHGVCEGDLHIQTVIDRYGTHEYRHDSWTAASPGERPKPEYDDDGGYHPVDAETWLRCWGV